jgi:hypothetical protein
MGFATLNLSYNPTMRRAWGRPMIKELDPVVLTESLPEQGLQAGDVGWVVMIHDDGTGYEVEFVTLSGETISVVTRAGHGGAPRRLQGNRPRAHGGVNQPSRSCP